MNDLFELLQKLLPAEIALIAGGFAYLLLLFKRMADEVISVSEKQAELAETQTQYIRERLDVVERTVGISEKTIGVSDRTFDLQEKQIEKLEALAKRREKEISRIKTALEEAREQARITEERYEETVGTLESQAEQVERLQQALRRYEEASQAEDIARIDIEQLSRQLEHTIKTEGDRELIRGLMEAYSLRKFLDRGDLTGLYELAEYSELSATTMRHLLEAALVRWEPKDEIFSQVMRIVAEHSGEPSTRVEE